jgi:hypothetical protein
MATKFNKISYGIVEDDEDRDADWMRQILYEVLESVAPPGSSRSYAAYKVPQHDSKIPSKRLWREHTMCSPCSSASMSHLIERL